MVFGDFNLPNVKWVNTSSRLEYYGSISDQVQLIGDQYSLISFNQINEVRNVYGSTLDLLFTNANNVFVDKALDYLMPCDSYHPALSISFLNQFAIPSLDTKHKYYDFNSANYN